MDQEYFEFEFNNERANYGKYLSIGFDDFRDSDFSLVIPLFNQYNAKATFNIISRNYDLSVADRSKIQEVISNNHELGDHTWFHCNYIYTDPLFNGQNPYSLEGSQTPFPSNEDLRNDIGDGCNAFGFNLDEPITNQLSSSVNVNWNKFDCSWRHLTDEQCQIIRDEFSIYKDKSGKLDLLDSLSNKYLGTSGKSYGSFNKEKGCYTGGIFTDAKTSSNHEIWERIVQITDLYYKENLEPSFKFLTWSWPGDPRSPFKYCHNGRYYFDKEHTRYNNYLAKFNSSITNESRSWTDVLRDNGYKICHDTIFPSRFDGQPKVAMYNQLILNASYSRKDALAYRTNSGISWDTTLSCGKEATEYSDCENSAVVMYEKKGEYFNLIESLRHDTSNGLVHGEIIDSYNSYSEKIFLQQVLEFCVKENIKVVTKKEAYDVCFNNVIESGNLIYNPDFKNSAKDFLPLSSIVPDNPDGYRGDCFVKYGKNNTLKINDYSYYLHYGIPTGTIAYEADIKGTGNIKIFAIQNKSPGELRDSNLKLLCEKPIQSKIFKRQQLSFKINDYPEKEYEQLCEGLGDKIMGIKIVYVGNISIKNINMQKVK